MTLPRGKQLRRDWSEALVKVDEENACRVCGRNRRQLAAAGLRLEAAHTAGREHDEVVDGAIWVNPADIVPLCGPATSSGTCHGKDHGHEIDLGAYLTKLEQARVVFHLGFGLAEKRLYRKTIAEQKRAERRAQQRV